MSEVTNYLWSSKLPFQDRLLFFGVISLAFGDLPYLYTILGGFSMQGGAYVFAPVALLSILLIILRFRIKIPFRGAGCAFIFLLLWLTLSVVANFEDIVDHSLQGRSGIAQLLRQSVVLLVGILTTLFIFNRYCRESGRISVDRGVIISVCFVIPVALLQFFAQLQIPLTREISAAIGAVFRYTDMSAGGIRVSGFKSEPSLFGIWTAFFFPFLAVAWLVLLRYDRLKRWLAFVLIFVIFVSGSRTAIGVVVAQIVLMLFLAGYYGEKLAKKKARHLMRLLILMLVISSVVLPGIIGDASSHIHFDIARHLQGLWVVDSADDVGGAASDHWESNAIRLGAQLANILMGMDNLTFGVGFSQSPFMISKYIPGWSEGFVGGRDPFTGAGIHARFFAEMGLPGLILWLSFWGLLFLGLHKQCKQYQLTPNIIQPIIFLMIGLGLFMGGFSQDSFSYFEYWVYFGLAFAQMARPIPEARPPIEVSIIRDNHAVRAEV